MIELPTIGYTLGDQAGVGPELVEKALAMLPAGVAHFVPVGPRLAGCEPGCPSEDSARMALEHLELAAQALHEGRIDAVVTAPVCKEALQSIGFPFPGQTEFFAERLGAPRFAMCLAGQRLTVALCTTHLALEEVPRRLSAEQILDTGELLCDFLRHLGVPCPRLAVAGLNPHNGEGGAFGDEEQRIITPAVHELQRRVHGLARVAGPCVPDAVYREAALGGYDAVIAPYHDQALIPLKLLDFHTAVNATLGLPHLRVSPDHGTAFSLAGRGVARPSSTYHAFLLALRYLTGRDFSASADEKLADAALDV